MIIRDLQEYLLAIKRKSRMTDEAWDKAEIQITVTKGATMDKLRYNINISDVCVDRVEIWVQS